MSSSLVSPYPLRLWLQNRLLNRFGFYPCLTNIRPRSGLGSHINICCCDYSTTRYSMYPSQPEYGVHDTWTFHRVNLQLNVSCFTALNMMLHAVVITCCFLASCRYITVCSGLIVIDLFLIFDDCFFFTILLICFIFTVGLIVFVFVVVVMLWFCRFLSHSIIVTTFLFCCRCFNFFHAFLF